MIRSQILLGYVHAEPFVPFRIVMTSGKTYEVRHPEMLDVGRDVCLYFHRPKPRQPFFRYESVSLMLIEHVEHLEADGATGEPRSRKR